jgi:hypothetical protein
MVESSSPTDGSHKGVCGKLRMVAVENLDQGSIWRIEDKLLKNTSVIRTDAYKGYNILDPMKHKSSVVPSKIAHKLLP